MSTAQNVRADDVSTDQSWAWTGPSIGHSASELSDGETQLIDPARTNVACRNVKSARTGMRYSARTAKMRSRRFQETSA